MRSILIVADSIVARRGLGSWFADDYQVTEAESGAAALELTKETRFHLVITEVDMPGMSGVELVRRLRAAPEHKDVPIFVVTTQSSMGQADVGRDAGVSAWMLKPVNPILLRRAVRNVMADGAGSVSAGCR